jgi:hypothetical protein
VHHQPVAPAFGQAHARVFCQRDLQVRKSADPEVVPQDRPEPFGQIVTAIEAHAMGEDLGIGEGATGLAQVMI